MKEDYVCRRSKPIPNILIPPPLPPPPVSFTISGPPEPLHIQNESYDRSVLGIKYLRHRIFLESPRLFRLGTNDTSFRGFSRWYITSLSMYLVSELFPSSSAPIKQKYKITFVNISRFCFLQALNDNSKKTIRVFLLRILNIPSDNTIQ